jgi:hypothetical protein
METTEIQLLVDLGVLNPRADEFSALTVWGMLIKDPVVWKRKIALPRNPRYPAMIAHDAEFIVIAAMTADEKKQLADRILAKCANRKPGI